MKLIVLAALSASLLQAKKGPKKNVLNLKADTNIHFTKEFDDEVLGGGRVEKAFLGTAPNDGGSCPEFTRQMVFDMYKTNIYDFRSARRVALHETGEISIPIKAGPRKFKFRNKKFKDAVVKGYNGYITLRNPGSTNRDIDLNILKEAYDGGWFFVQKTMDKSYLQWQYGNSNKNRDGFIPNTAWVFTFVYFSTAGSGCASSVGNTFQVVLIIDKFQRSRIIYNYADLNDISSVPEVSFTSKLNDDPPITTNVQLDGVPITDINQLDDITIMFQQWTRDNTLIQVSDSPLVSPPDVPRTCGSTEHCVCRDIVTEQDNVKFLHPNTGAILTVAEVTDHFDFFGRCSRDDESWNYGGYGWRGHICWVSGKSDQCTNGGQSNKIFHNTDIGAVSDLDMLIPGFVCALPKGSANGEPHWQRIQTKEEKDLIRDLSKRKKRASGGSWKQKQKKRKNIAEAKRVSDAYVTEQDLAHSDGDRFVHLRPKANVNVRCNSRCSHPNTWSQTPVSFNPFANVNFQGDTANTVWSCTQDVVDISGATVTEILTGSEDVNYGAMCYLTCSNVAGPADMGPIMCQNWAEGPANGDQFNRNQMRVMALALVDGDWDTCA